MAYEASPIDTDPLVHQAALDLARASFEYYNYYSFSRKKRRKWLRNWHHKLVAEKLQDVFDGKIKRLIINEPPRYSKTEQAVVNFTEWAMGHVPTAEWIHTSYAAPLARKNSGLILNDIQSDWYRELFPEVILDPKSTGKGDWKTTAGGVFYATGMKGSITGFGAGKPPEPGKPWSFQGAILVDDPVKPKDAMSDVKRQEANDFWADTLESRRNWPEETPVIVTMQRLHDDDFTAHLLANSGEDWEVVLIPAEHPETGEPCWPAKHSRARLEMMKAANPAVFAAQYNQNPRQKGGNLIKSEWFVRLRCALEDCPQLRYRMIIADTAQKTKERNDYSVLMHVGYRQDNGDMVILDILRGKWESPELRKTARSYWQKCKALEKMPNLGALRSMSIEDKSSGTGLIQDLRRGEPGANIPPIPVAAIQRNIDKFTRVSDVAPTIEVKRVSLLVGPDKDDPPAWLAPFIDECEAFSAEDTHKHDDMVDVLCDGVKAIGKRLDLSDVL